MHGPQQTKCQVIETADVEDRPEATHEVDNDDEDGWNGAVNGQI